MQLWKEHAHSVIERLESQEITAEELTISCFDRIEAVEPKVKAYISLYKEDSLKEAKKIDNKRKKGEKLGPLAGIPLSLKANISVNGYNNNCGSHILEGYIAPFDAFVVKKLIREAGAIFIGHLNMDEFAMGSSTESSYFGNTHNPWDLAKVPGGSSGGSAAAMAADEGIMTLGSDTGGSIRCPASYTGTVGIKPTYGRNSRYGIVAYSNSLEQVGPLAKCVKDSSLMLQIMAGYDDMDSTSANLPVDSYSEMLEGGIDDLTIGIPKEFMTDGIDPEIINTVKSNISSLEKMGAQIQEISLPNLKYALPTYYIIAMSEASSNLARYDGLRYGYRTKNKEKIKEIQTRFKAAKIPISQTAAEFMVTRMEGFGSEVKRRIILGTYALSAGYADQYYVRAQKVRTLIKNDFISALKKCDILMGPTMPNTAFSIGTKTNNPMEMYMEDILTVPINLAAVPSISINGGFDTNNMPIGIQFIGKYFDEKTILKTAYTLEQKLQLFKRKPQL